MTTIENPLQVLLEEGTMPMNENELTLVFTKGEASIYVTASGDYILCEVVDGWSYAWSCDVKGELTKPFPIAMCRGSDSFDCLRDNADRIGGE